jgi:predicted membrane-bound mannosyltransferase
LTKIEAIPSSASALVETDIRESSPKADVEKIATNARTKQSIKTIQEVTTKLEASNSIRKQGINVIQQESIGMVETTSNFESLNNQAVSTKQPSNFNNPININDTPLPISSANLDAEPTEVEKVLPNYEIIDTEDPSRTIFIANFEIDGAAFRGITRRVSALLKRNKSEKEK